MLISLIVISILSKLGDINGHYVSQIDANNYNNEIFFDFQKVDDKDIKFQANSYWVGPNSGNVNTGVIGGVIPLVDGKAIYSDNYTEPKEAYDPKQPDKFQGCHAEITFNQDSTIHVEDNYNCGGMNVTFNGDYRRKSFNVTDWSLFDSL